MNDRLKAHLRRVMPKTIRSRRILAGPLRGCRITTSWHDYPAAILGRTERALLDWFAGHVSPGETWLDIGAHYGYTSIALSRLVGPEGRTFAFEPLLQTAGCILRTRRANRLAQLTVVPVGLDASSALTLKSLPSVRGMVDSTWTGGGWSETIFVAQLDWLWPQICGARDRIDGVKIDVQGMEIDAVRGMSALLKRFKPKLVLEFHRDVSRTAILDLLREAGYSSRPAPIEPVEGETEPRYLDNRSYAFTAP
jgi:FkbM family methyltransferase